MTVTPASVGRAVVAVIACTLAAGCAAVPTAGPIQSGPPVSVDEQGSFYRAIPQPPPAGANPRDLVRAFLATSSSGADSYSVAREYLTSDAAARWNPAKGARIYDSSGLRLTVADNSVRLRAPAVGTISADDQYAVASAATSLDSSYGVVKDGGEWRIATLPDGLTLSLGDVQREYRTLPVYFLDPTASVVVPDPITIPVSSSALATVLVRALLRGPTAWAAPSVRTAFPEGTALAFDAVPVEEGVAQVDLNSRALTSDDQARRAMAAQLVWTLRRLPNVTSLRISVDGQPLAVSGAPNVQSLDDWASFDPDARSASGVFASTPGGLVAFGPDGKATRVPGRTVGLTSPAVSRDGATIAAISRDRRSLLVGSTRTGPTTSRFVGTDLSRPSFDRSGAVWIVDRGSRVWLVPEGTSRPVAVPLLGLPTGSSAVSIVSLQIAPDATRATLLLRRGTAVELWLARVERDGSVIRLAGLLRADPVDVDVIDAAWRTSDELSVLARDRGGSVVLYAVPMGLGRVTSVAAPSSAATVASASQAPTLLGSDVRLFELENGGWIDRGPGADPTYPG